MKALQDQYAELLKLTRTYLLQEYTLNDRLLAEKETYDYFCNFARRTSSATLQSNKLPPSIPAATSIPPPSIPKSEITAKAKTKSNAVLVCALPKEEPLSSSVDGSVNLEQVKKEPGVKTRANFVPELPSSVEAVDVSEIRKILSQKHPSIHFMDAIPSDMEAKKKAKSWEQGQLSQILIFNFARDLKYKHFLENLCLAIEVYGWRIKIINGAEIEKTKKWDAILSSKNLQLVIATNRDIEDFFELKKLYLEAKPGKFTLSGIPVFLMADPEVYLANPQLKPVLWKTLKEILM